MPAAPKTLTFGYAQTITCLDPAFQTGTPDSNLLDNIFSSLVTHKPGTLTEVQGDLAESWEISDDGLVYTFKLHPGVQWQYGYGEVTAQDVVYSWERIINPDTAARGGTVFNPVESIEALDDLTVQVTLKAPSAPFLINIAHSPTTKVVNQEAVEERGDEHCLRPVGSGAYQVEAADPTSDIVLEAFDGYFRGRPAIDQVIFTVIPEESVAVLALKSGEIDYAIVREPANIVSLLEDPNIVVNADENFSASTLALWLNNTREPFDDVRVRRALIHAIDRETLVREATEGFLNKVAHTVVPPSLLGYTEDVMQYPYDPDLARQLLEEAGYPEGTLIVEAQAMRVAFNPIMLTIVQEMWAEVGVNLEIEFLERAALRERQAAGDYDITVSNPTRAEVDAILDFFRCQNMPPGPNFALYSGPCDLIDAQASTIDQAERIEMLQDIQRQIAEDAPVIPLWYPVEVTAATSRVTGMIPNLGGWQTKFEYFDIQP